MPAARVTVRFEESLRPFRADALCDAAGRFAIGGLPAGTARVAARGPEGTAASSRVFVSPSRGASVDLALAPGRLDRPRRAAASADRGGASSRRTPHGALVGGIALGPDGAPVAGVRVALESERAGVWSETVTDAAGRFAFRVAPLEGPSRVEALGAAYEGQVGEDGPLLPGAALVLPLTPLSAIRGTLARGATLLLESSSDADADSPVAIPLEGGPFLAAGIRPGPTTRASSRPAASRGARKASTSRRARKSTSDSSSPRASRSTSRSAPRSPSAPTASVRRAGGRPRRSSSRRGT